MPQTRTGKTTSIRTDLERDLGRGAEVWIVDPSYNLPDWANRAGKYAATIEEARSLLVAAVGWEAADRRLVVVIEDAPTVFADGPCRRTAEYIVRYDHRLPVRLRVTAQTPSLEQFGGSTCLRAALTRC